MKSLHLSGNLIKFNKTKMSNENSLFLIYNINTTCTQGYNMHT